MVAALSFISALLRRNLHCLKEILSSKVLLCRDSRGNKNACARKLHIKNPIDFLKVSRIFYIFIINDEPISFCLSGNGLSLSPEPLRRSGAGLFPDAYYNITRVM